MAGAILGKVKYYADDTPGTVTLGSSEKLIALWCVATGTGGYVTIAGGPQIPLIPGVPFSLGVQSRSPEWVGVAIVFSGTSSYFVEVMGPFA